MNLLDFYSGGKKSSGEEFHPELTWGGRTVNLVSEISKIAYCVWVCDHNSEIREGSEIYNECYQELTSYLTRYGVGLSGLEGNARPRIDREVQALDSIKRLHVTGELPVHKSVFPVLFKLCQWLGGARGAELGETSLDEIIEEISKRRDFLKTTSHLRETLRSSYSRCSEEIQYDTYVVLKDEVGKLARTLTRTVFLSHSKRDFHDEKGHFKVARQRVTECAYQNGFHVLWDEDEIPAGTADWEARIRKLLLNADAFVALTSRSYFSSPNCEKELAFFRARSSGEQSGITPVVWTASKVPRKLRGLQFLRCDDLESYRVGGYLSVLKKGEGDQILIDALSRSFKLARELRIKEMSAPDAKQAWDIAKEERLFDRVSSRVILIGALVIALPFGTLIGIHRFSTTPSAILSATLFNAIAQVSLCWFIKRQSWLGTVQSALLLAVGIGLTAMVLLYWMSV